MSTIHERSTEAMPSLAAMAWPEAEQPIGSARVLYGIRREALTLLSKVLVDEGARALLVKGAALAETVYPVPWDRPMADIDVIVERADLARIRAALTRTGWNVSGPAERPLTQMLLEVSAWSPGRFGSCLLELHLSLDKVVLRNTDVASLFARAEHLPELPGLLVPNREDSVLLTVLHLAASEFDHLPGFVDIELLLSRGLDLDLVVSRARQWRATTPLYIALRTLEGLIPGMVPQTVIDRLAPGRARALLLSRYFEIGAWPVARRPTEVGWPWIARQTSLRDDTLHWMVGLGAYAARRSIERAALTLRTGTPESLG